MNEFKKPADSDIEIAAIMEPRNCNVSGNIFGGKILALMDHAAYACACRHARASTVTASINTVNFRTPIYVGDLVVIKAKVNYVGKTSVTVGMRVEAENPITGDKRHSNSSYFTMVAVDAKGKTQAVPGLILSELNEARRFVDSYQKRGHKKDTDPQMPGGKFTLTPEIIDWLQKQNVRLEQSLLAPA